MSRIASFEENRMKFVIVLDVSVWFGRLDLFQCGAELEKINIFCIYMYVEGNIVTIVFDARQNFVIIVNDGMKHSEKKRKN